MFDPFMGKRYSDIEIRKLLDKYEDQIIYNYESNVCQKAAYEISIGNVVAWFQDGSECGPRALGNRSILADPRNSQMKDTLNSKVKFREEFRPFAPAVLWEYQQEYFDLDIPSPYMLMIADVVNVKRKVIPAVTHVDGTARLQTAIKELSPMFYQLIQEFYFITNVPIVINTSFNIKGEPIVETPNDAMNSFLKSGIDDLFIGNYHIMKKSAGD
jgi:carbamoyltransferase